MTPFVIFGLGAVGTFALRVGMVIGEGRLAETAWLQHRVPFVSPAVLAAIVVSAVSMLNGQVVTPSPVVLAAVGIGAYAVHRTGNVAAALVAGLPIYWLAALIGLI
jgi:branched-subunit amino acid transport protein